MIKKIVITGLLLFLPLSALAQEGIEPDLAPAEGFYRGEVLEIVSEETLEYGGDQVLNQVVKIKILNGDEKDKELEVNHNGVFIGNGSRVDVGDKIVVYKIEVQGEAAYYIADHYRLPGLGIAVLLFFLVAILFGRWRGVTSILGLLVSILVIVQFIVPQIIDGKNPLLISLIGALIIAIVSIYLSHGFIKRTSIALAGTLITLSVAAGLSFVFVKASRLLGIGSEEAFYLQFSTIEALNLQGLLLGGIILGALGVLDDITTAQSATVEELHKANPEFSIKELYKRGISVGKEHIASLVNTLFLAYAGASLPLFLLFSTAVSRPLWVTLNSEQIGEEIIRTMVGSIGLILAVPITTFLAAYFFGKKRDIINESHNNNI